MSLRNLIKHTILILICLLPLAYLWWAWNTLPAGEHPLHFDISNQPNGFGNDKDLLNLTIIMCGVNILVYLLMVNIHRIDPKRIKAGKSQTFDVIGTGTVLFVTALNFLIIFNAQQPEAGLMVRVTPILLGLMFAFLGNVMYNVKPNYFAGIRIPWTLNDEENWKKTHRLAGVVWFIGGIFLTIVALTATSKTTEIFQRIILMAIIIIPVGYSFLFFLRKRQLDKQQ